MNVDELKLSEKNIVQISAGIFHTVALDEGGKVYTWGENYSGQLENETLEYSAICLSDKDNELKGKRIVDISAGEVHTVAIDEEGKVYTWGYNEDGQLGDGTTTNSVLPICISNKENELKGKNVTSILAGDERTVAIDEEKKIYVWGINADDILGYGIKSYITNPICVSDKKDELKEKKQLNIVIANKNNLIVIDEEGYMSIRYKGKPM